MQDYSKKLLQYSTFAIAFIRTENSFSQAVYTDLEPDVVLDSHFEAELIDMDSNGCLLYTSPSPRDRTRSRMPSSA